MQIPKHIKSSLLYSNFLTRILMKKKSSYVTSIIIFIITMILTIIAHFISKKESDFLIISYVTLTINLITTVVFASIKALHIFKDSSKEGIDILVFSKSISRKNVIVTKLLFFLAVGVIWSFVIFVSLIIFYLSTPIYAKEINYFYISSFFSPLFTFLIFGLIASIIAIKGSSKLAMALPIAIFFPLMIIGSITSVFNNTGSNKMAKDFNIESRQHHSKTLLDAEKFYLNNNKDNFYLVPNGLNNLLFNEHQKEFMQKSLLSSKNSSSMWQSFSWLSIPYQLIDVFAKKDNDPIGVIANHNTNNKKEYVYANTLDSKEFNYTISKKANLPQYQIRIKENNNDVIKEVYIVPGALKNNSYLSNKNIVNKEIIFARKDADNQDVIFKEDTSLFASPDNLVGKLKWEYIKEALESSIFIENAKFFVEKNLLNKNKTKKEILKEISNLLKNDLSSTDTKNENFNSWIDNKTILLSKDIDVRHISNLTEKKVYFATTLIYFIYFNYNDTQLLDTLLFNENSNDYSPSQVEITIDGYDYFIGGYKDYSSQQFLKKTNNPNQKEKIINRYKLEKSNNYLFQISEEVYEVKPIRKIVVKEFYGLIWFLLTIGLFMISYSGYIRKDYK